MTRLEYVIGSAEGEDLSSPEECKFCVFVRPDRYLRRDVAVNRLVGWQMVPCSW